MVCTVPCLISDVFLIVLVLLSRISDFARIRFVAFVLVPRDLRLADLTGFFVDNVSTIVGCGTYVV